MGPTCSSTEIPRRLRSKRGRRLKQPQQLLLLQEQQLLLLPTRLQRTGLPRQRQVTGLQPLLILLNHNKEIPGEDLLSGDHHLTGRYDLDLSLLPAQQLILG